MSANLTPGDTLILPDGKYIAVLQTGGTLVFGSMIQSSDGNITLGFLDPPPANMTYNSNWYVTRGYTEPHVIPTASGPVDPEALTAPPIPIQDLQQADTSIASNITYYEPKEQPDGPRLKNIPPPVPCTDATVTAGGSGGGSGGGRRVMTSGGLMMSAGDISYIEILGLNGA